MASRHSAAPARRRRWPWVVVGGLAVLALIGQCGGPDTSTPAAAPVSAASTTTAKAPSATTVAPAPTTNPAPVPVPVAAPAPAVPAREPVTLGRVIDGDTFELADGRRVRVLGIDSCEVNTYGGEQARTAAQSQLANPYSGSITMTREPGVDTDQYGRLLRYVQLAGGIDFGEFMVKYDHTGVYQGRNDAAPESIARLYAADTDYAANPPAGRSCADPYPAAPTSGNTYEYESDDDGDVNMPDGALTGGYCRGKWWC